MEEKIEIKPGDVTGNIIIAVTGGIAAYKAADIVSSLVKYGHTVRVVMTESAKKFITPLTLSVLSKQPVFDDASEWEINGQVTHIELAKWAAIFAVVPATANTLSKMVNGTADNLLTSIYLALPWKEEATAHVRIYPAMNTHMYEKEQTQQNIRILKERDRHWVMNPDSGMLACGDVGMGKLPSVSAIVGDINRDFLDVPYV